MTRPLGPLGKRLVRCGELARAHDRDGFDDEARELAKSFVSGGMDAGARGTIQERVASVHAELRRAILLSIVNQADPRAKSTIDALALVCANLDARIAQYGPLPDPLAVAPEEDPEKPTTKKRRA